MALYKGYIATNGKRPQEKLKGRKNWKKFNEVKDLDGYGGVLADDTILIDIDDKKQSEIMMKIVEKNQLNCKVYQTTRGRHFLFKNHVVEKNSTHTSLAIGLTADIKIGTKLSYEVIKINGEERWCEWDIEDDKEYDEIPYYFLPVRHKIDFVDMEAGDGRNQALFSYILSLQGSGFSVDEIRDTIRLINSFILKEPLPESELETILREEAFEKPIFFINGKTFQHDVFAHYMAKNHHVVKINDQLHIYHNGIYVNDFKTIEAAMIREIPTLKKAQRKETIDYMDLFVENVRAADARYIAFANGLYDLASDTMKPFDPDIIVSNKIPWNYDSETYNELADTTLNKLACGDKSIRALLEECIGYCFYRRNELGKAFILTGDRQNGKSTFLDLVKTLLGESNISALDLKELGDRFTTSMMFGKLANIGDDIGDDFLQGTQVSIFKKIVTGNRIKAERKGQDPFEFNPYIKLLFSANDIPRMKDKTGAILRRLIIIPFNARFTKDDPDYRPFIKYELSEREPIEYLARLGIEGLKRILTNSDFTASAKVIESLQEYEEENNPIITFISEQGEDMIINEPTCDVYKRYQVFCAENSMQPMSNIVFSKQINKRMNTETNIVWLNGKSRRVFIRKKGGNEQ